MKLEDFLTLEPLAQSDINELETPVPIIDADVVERNLQRWQARCETLGLANRPHIKTHKLVGLAKYQLALGAQGITVQKLSEAEVMADAGISDMLVTFNILGAAKLARLTSLMKRTDISVVADNSVVVAGLGEAARAAGRDLSVLVECDTGGERNGVQSPPEVAALAREIEDTPGLSYGGLMTYAKTGTRLQAQSFFRDAETQVKAAGLTTRVTSTGGSPDMWLDDGLPGMSEYRAGTYVYFDRSLVVNGTCGWDDCALTVLSTVVSRPTADRALLDAGSKALTSDLIGMEGYGVVHALGDAQVYALNEEHGYLDISALADKPHVGDVLRVMPNHVCPVTNLFDKVVFVRGSRVLGAVSVDARGAVQ